MTVKNIQIGAFGWQHSGWVDTYYPDDLPEDWQLDFYSHHFAIVLVPESEWLQASEDEIEQWLEDVNDGFEFLFAVNQSSITEVVTKQLSVIKHKLAQNFAGIVVTPMQGNLEESDANRLKALTPVYIDDAGSSADEYTSCWRKESLVKNAEIGFITLKDTDTLRDVRASIEAFLEQSGDQQTAYMIFEGDSPSAKTMQDTQVVIQMLM